MSPKDKLYKLVDDLPEERVAEVERFMLQMLRTDAPQPELEEPMSFEDALAYTNQELGPVLKRLA